MQAEPTAPYVCRVRADMASPTNQARSLGDLGGEHIAQDTRNGMRRERGGNEQRAMSWQAYLAERGHVIVMQAPRVSSFDILRILRIPIFHESANI